MAELASPATPLPRLHVRHRVEAFLRRTGVSATRFGMDVAGDPRLVSDLRRGREPRPAMIRRIEHFMNKHEETMP